MRRVVMWGWLALAPMVATACQGASPEQDDKLVFFNWWTSPGELAALNKLVAVFTARYPDVTIENAVVTGGPATDLRLRLYDQGLNIGPPPPTHPPPPAAHTHP